MGDLVKCSIASYLAGLVIGGAVGFISGLGVSKDQGRMEICREVGFTTEICTRIKNEKLGIKTEVGDGGSTNEG